MNSMIGNLERRIEEMGLTVEERKQDDFLYIITVPCKGKGEFLIYTTSKAVESDGKFCFRLHQITEHVPFSVVTPESVKEFIWQKESFCLMMDLDLGRFNPNSKGIFIPVYLDALKGKKIDSYKYNVAGISVEEVANRILAAQSI